MSASEWGRVTEDGTVYVLSAQGERAVGQYPEGPPEEALAFYTERYEALAFEVHLLEVRVNTGRLSPDDATTSVRTVREQVKGAAAVGDLDSLAGRLDALGPVIAQQRDQRRAERAEKLAEAKHAKERIAGQAESVAEGSDWRNGASRLSELLGEWKKLPRLDRPTDDALWRRFSSARTGYARRRKQHFAELNEKRGVAGKAKERLAAEAEGLSSSTDWGATAGRFRDMMREWKAVGPAQHDVDERLWKRFRGAQDAFFGARDAANARIDEEFAANAVIKDALLAEAESLLPVTDVDAAKRSFREIAQKWDAAGKVPRDRIKELEGRMRAVEQAIRGVEDARWQRSDPEKSARADDMVTKLEATIADLGDDLAAARARGDHARASRLQQDLDSRRAFLAMARRAAADYS